MINTLEKSARTVDAAIEEALKELHMSRDDVSVEILDMGKTGFFGIGASPARVRVSYETPDPAPVKPEKKPAPVKAERPVAPKAEKPAAPKAEKPVKAEKPAAPAKAEVKGRPPPSWTRTPTMPRSAAFSPACSTAWASAPTWRSPPAQTAA